VDNFPIIILTGLPASGKSEIIHYLKTISGSERSSRFRIADMDILDDFPLLWSWFVEDDLLNTKYNQARLYTDKDGYFLQTYFWDLLIARLDWAYNKRLRDEPEYHDRYTTIFEFSRGSEHGGYQQALSQFSDQVLKKADLVYVRVSFEESLRKNRKRFNPDRPDSILEHSMPDEKLERQYRFDDWEELSADNPNFIKVRSLQVPYFVFENEDDVTSGDSQLLANRLHEVLNCLWEIRSKST